MKNYTFDWNEFKGEFTIVSDGLLILTGIKLVH